MLGELHLCNHRLKKGIDSVKPLNLITKYINKQWEWEGEKKE